MSYTNGLDNPELYFQVKLYTGTGSSQSITLDGDENMQPDLVWVKGRNATSENSLFDAVRGVNKRLRSNANGVETTAANSVTAFNSDGFTVVSHADTNTSSNTYVAWCWKAGGSGSSNTDGSINTTKTSANTTSGFSIVTYTGDGNSSATLGHGLSSAPKVLINKTRSLSGYDWNVLHGALGATKYLYLSSTAAEATNIGMWNNTAPTSSVFTVGTYDNVNKVSETYITYCFSEKQGYSKFGSYTGNGNADGTFIHLGFRPAFFLCKRTDSGNNWVIYDNKRPNSFNEITHVLLPNDSVAEQTSTSDDDCDFLSNGVKMRCSNNGSNGSSATYIFMAFAEAPFVNSNGVPCNAR